MRTLRGITILFIAALVVIGGPQARAGEDGESGNDLLAKAEADLGSAAQAILEAMKKRIDSGDFKAVEDLMGLLREVMRLRAAVQETINPSGPTDRPPRRGALDVQKNPNPAAPPTRGATNWFGGRGGRRNLKSNGGSMATSAAVDLALAWLARHQNRTGQWGPGNFTEHCSDASCAGTGNALYYPGTTALSLLSFLGTGHNHKQGQYRQIVGRGLNYLLEIQDGEGCIGKRTTNHFTYNHALGAQALAEAFALSRDPRLKRPAQAAIDFILKAQNPYLGWRYGLRPKDNDTSVTAMMVSALMAGKKAGLRVSPEAFSGAMSWIEKVTEPEYGRVGYTTMGTGPARPQNLMDKFPSDKSESLTAAGILTRIYCGEDPRKSEQIQKGADLCLKAPPIWDEAAGTIDFYYWYYGTQALFQVGGDAWKAWNKSIQPALVNSQIKTGCASGSWAPVGVWCQEGGRVYSTTMATLALETYYRHGRLFERRTFGRK